MLQGSIPCYQCLHKKSQTQTILHLPPVYVLAHTKCLPSNAFNKRTFAVH